MYTFKRTKKMILALLVAVGLGYGPQIMAQLLPTPNQLMVSADVLEVASFNFTDGGSTISAEINPATRTVTSSDMETACVYSSTGIAKLTFTSNSKAVGLLSTKDGTQTLPYTIIINDGSGANLTTVTTSDPLNDMMETFMSTASNCSDTVNNDDHKIQLVLSVPSIDPKSPNTPLPAAGTYSDQVTILVEPMEPVIPTGVPPAPSS